MWTTWTPRTHSGAGSTWRSVGSGTCSRYPTPNFTGKGLPLYRLLLMELWKVPALMETSVARSLFLPPDNNLLEAVVSLDREHTWVVDSAHTSTSRFDLVEIGREELGV